MNNSTPTAQISIIVRELNDACTTIKNSDLQKEAARLKAISAARDLVGKLESPAETIFRDAFSVRIVDYNHNGPERKVLKPCSNLVKGPDRVCVRLAIQLGIFSTLTKRNGLPINASDLAAACGTEVMFLGKMFNTLNEQANH